MAARYSAAVVGTYVLLIVLIAVLVLPQTVGDYRWVGYFLLAVTAMFVVRYFSTHYVLDDTHFHASRLLGSRRILLEDVRAIEYASLRNLTSTGGTFGMGSWGWRGRMHSVDVGEFDSIYTDAAAGLLVTAGAYPVYISPRDRDAFARELSRRVRSYTGPLEKDVGAPGPAPSV
jgi:hypothetical protein